MTCLFATLALTFVATLTGTAQQRAGDAPRALTVAEYERAERFMTYNTTPLVSNGAVRATWLPDDRFWYRNQHTSGNEFLLVDAVRGTKAPAFDHAAVAAALTAAMAKPVTAARLPFMQITFDGDRQSFSFHAEGRRWTCDVRGKQCANGNSPATPPNSVVSPDGKLAAFIRDHNLWMRELVAGTDTQLTTDGVKDFGYATDNAGWSRSDAPVVLWSPRLEEDRHVPAGRARRGARCTW